MSWDGSFKLYDWNVDFFEKHVNKSVEKWAKSNHSNFTPVTLEPGDEDLDILNIIYINLDTAVQRNEDMIMFLRKFGFSSKCKCFRFSAIALPEDRIRACYLSHLTCLAWAADNLKGNVLILEDDFIFTCVVSVVREYMEKVQRCTGGRWDVIHFGQYVHEWSPFQEQPQIYRLLHSTTDSGYLVHADYVSHLFFKFLQAYEEREIKFKFENTDYQDQLQIHIQKRDLWIGFEKSLAEQKQGVSTISTSTTVVHNAWNCTNDKLIWYDTYGQYYVLYNYPPTATLTITILMKVHPHGNTQKCQHYCNLHLFKPHRLLFVEDEYDENISFVIHSNVWISNALPFSWAAYVHPYTLRKCKLFYPRNPHGVIPLSDTWFRIF